MELTITLTDEDQIALLQSIATKNNLTAEQYASNLVIGWLGKRVRNKYESFVKSSDLNILKPALDQSIAIRELEKEKESKIII